ncbi:hypothetical protein GGX14DRAFT_402240 [Mycena pura]|uniref:Transmembrane protein n=1 Tax=Mycena pura TaxID=153505 RepID=A0AAD6UY99_9AGAR|nr:hypothetical protein GGX14DRAFT_402240 [Mycena pura]
MTSVRQPDGIRRHLRTSTRTRVWSFRLLVIFNIGLLAMAIAFMDPLGIVITILTLSHHIFQLFKPGNARVDIMLVSGEIITFFVSGPSHSYAAVTVSSPFNALGLIPLFFALHFRLLGRRHKTFDFFSGCDLQQSHYTPWRILFGLREPLVSAMNYLITYIPRGESSVIIGIRTFVLFSLCFVIPAFGVYVMFLVPIGSQAMTRDVKISQSWKSAPFTDDVSEQNITIVLLYVGNTTSVANVTVGDQQGCTDVNLSAWSPQATATCPLWWSASMPGGIVLKANFTDSWGILYVKPGQGDPFDVDTYTEPIPLIAGARLSAVLSRTNRKIFSKSALDILGLTTPLRTVMVNSVLLLQQDPNPPNTTDTAILRLVQRTDTYPFIPNRVVEDFTDASVLAGFATLGGFWTFMDGSFAILFGANLLYFLWRRKPLSAFGMVHVFQRRALMRNWNRDFPALHTEGGCPGSESAGIVAFIRERLIDLDDPVPKPTDPESPEDSAIPQPVVPVEGDNKTDTDSHLENDEISPGGFEVSEGLVSDPTREITNDETSALAIPLESVTQRAVS